MGSNATPHFKNLTSKDYGKPGRMQLQAVQDLTRPHVESFNYVLREGISNAVKCIPDVEFALPSEDQVRIAVTDAAIHKPLVSSSNTHTNTLHVYPAECRQRGSTYQGKLQLSFVWYINGKLSGREERVVGDVPIMVKSDACNLAGLSPAQLISHGEEAQEMGGYFIVNGNEKVIRMLVNPRRNHPTALTRPSWKQRGHQYTEYGVSMRCVKSDQSSMNIVLHYLNTGSANLCFVYRKEQFFVPLIMVLKSLVDVSDKFIYTEMSKDREDDSFFKGCILSMLREARNEGLASQQRVLEYIGERFRFKANRPSWYSDADVARWLIKECICIHLDDNMDKFDVLVYMTRKLFTFAKGGCAAESHDNPMFQEAMLGGHLYQLALKEKIETWLWSLKGVIERTAGQAKVKGKTYTLNQAAMIAASAHGVDISRAMGYMLATGNLVSKTGLGLMQMSGLAVIADKLNFYRYISHFRCIHRGAFFAEMRTTNVRKMLGEAWGFICPVHTPDGPPCGLLNHMAASCQIVNNTYKTHHLQKLLCDLGMVPYDGALPGPAEGCYVVMLDGRMAGWVLQNIAPILADKLRMMKVQGLNNVPFSMEICFVRHTCEPSQSPGLFLFTGPARLIRPVLNLAHNRTELIGTFEQAYMGICVTASEAIPGVTTHQELTEHSMLSSIASLTPYSDFNQSPRNMYQCQMGKQTMGFPLHAWGFRADNKLYRIQTPQTTMVRPYMYDHYGVDNYPLGTNAVVAVISYTGYDMEDAMILNKSAYERGFCHGSVYKSETVDLKILSGEKGSKCSLEFSQKVGDKRWTDQLGSDGLPAIGTYLQIRDPYYSYLNVQTGAMTVVLYKGQESAYVDQIKILGNDTGTGQLCRVCFMLRITRNPIIGDKFSSRHGQKGICSQKWPVQDLPFTESGMTPDIIFNPHGFPSRMTIGMMIESMAGKSASMHGLCHDATPFSFSEDHPAIDYFGKMLTKAGYNYHGTERMYSGVNGREFEADIFIGVVYYQRLRHMVSDKFQVRTTGPIDNVTHQPIKGRKRGGGVRFGEMERDGLLSHGSSFLLQDRLFHCSDESEAYVCKQCGSLLSPIMRRPTSEHAAVSSEMRQKHMCLLCRRTDTIQVIRIPYVFRYLVAELAAMNIKAKLEVSPI